MPQSLKRTFHIAGTEAQQIAKRLRTVERQTKRNKHELKSVTFTINGALATNTVRNVVLTAIGQGTNTNERIGDEIRLVKCECRGLADSDLEIYLIKLFTTSEPTASIFSGGKGAFVLDSEAGSRFKTLKHYRNLYVGNGASAPCKFTQKLGNTRTYYNQTTTTGGIRNQICFTLLNRDAATKNYNVTVRLWYTDG